VDGSAAHARLVRVVSAAVAAAQAAVVVAAVPTLFSLMFIHWHSGWLLVRKRPPEELEEEEKEARMQGWMDRPFAGRQAGRQAGRPVCVCVHASCDGGLISADHGLRARGPDKNKNKNVNSLTQTITKLELTRAYTWGGDRQRELSHAHFGVDLRGAAGRAAQLDDGAAVVGLVEEEALRRGAVARALWEASELHALVVGRVALVLCCFRCCCRCRR
jgi:hypothetical protein